MPTRGCGYCFKIYNDIDLETCDNCTGSFCKNCVPLTYTSDCYLLEDVKHYFCTKSCRDTYEYCDQEDCTTKWILRLKVYAPHPSYVYEEADGLQPIR